MSRRVHSMLHVVIREELEANQQKHVQPWTPSQLAQAVGVRQGVVSRWLAEDDCKRVVPLPQVCVTIAEALDMDVVEVFRLAGYLPQVESKNLGPHADEIKAALRRLRRILANLPEKEWPVAYAVILGVLDGLPLILNRLDGD